MDNFECLQKLLKCSYESGTDFSMPSSFYEQKILSLCEYLDSGKAFCYVAKDDDNVVGFLWACELDRVPKRVMHVLYLAVFEECQSKGYGRQLIEAVEKAATMMNIDLLELNVRISNPAIDFYKKNSFYVERVTMVKCLDSNVV